MIHNLYHFQENLQQQNILWKTRGKAVTISIRRWSPIFPATCKRYISFYLYWLKVYIHSNSSFEKNSIKVYISYRWFSQDTLPFPVKIFAMWQFYHLTEQFDGVVCSSYERHFFQLDLNSPYFGPSMTKCLSQMDSCHSRPSLNICLLIYSPGSQHCDSLIFPHLRYLSNLRRHERGIYLLSPVCRNCSPWTFHLASCIMTIIIIIIIIRDALKTTVFNGDFYRSSLS